MKELVYTACSKDGKNWVELQNEVTGLITRVCECNCFDDKKKNFDIAGVIAHALNFTYRTEGKSKRTKG